MSQSIPLITTLAIALGLALLLGFLAARLKLPVLLGYLVTGILVGPYTPGFVANAQIARELSELGVMLLMFGVGLHFSLSDLMTVRKIALPGAVLQIIVATALGTWVATVWGWRLGEALIFGLSLSVASTVVLLRALEVQHNALESISGRIAVGWLVVEDIAMVIVIVLLPPFAGWLDGKPGVGIEANLLETLGFILFKISAFVAFMIIVGYKLFPKILWHITRTGSRELFTLCVIATAITVAFISSKLFGVSFALGAFFAGMMMRESQLSRRAAEESLPLREAFAVLFFVSVGMLFDPRVLIHHPIEVLAVIGVIVVGKTLAAAILILCFRYPLNTALLVSAGLAQIGEFSFILAGLGVELGLLPVAGQSLILAGAFISIALNPLLFKLIGPFQHWITSKSAFAKKLQQSANPLPALPIITDEKYLSGQVVLVGYGQMEQRIGEILFKNGIPYIVSEKTKVSEMTALFENVPEPEILIKTHVSRASMLIIAISDMFYVQALIKTARTINPTIKILVCVHNKKEARLLSNESVEKVFYSEDELATNISTYVLNRYGIVS